MHSIIIFSTFAILCRLSSAAATFAALTLGPDNSYEGKSIDIGWDCFNSLVQNSGVYIIERECSSCAATHQYIYYKRLTDQTTFDYYSNMLQWNSDNNDLEDGDFNLYSSYADAIAGTNAWTYCNYDDVAEQVGAFRDCGPTGWIVGQWTADVPGGANSYAKPAKFDIIFYTGSAAKSGGLNLDFMNGVIENTLNNGRPISPFVMYLIYALIVSLLVTIVCFGYYNCLRGKKSRNNKYKVVSLESTEYDTDMEDK